MRGDEPELTYPGIIRRRVFPTCVGMNREWHLRKIASARVPHMRGDEPIGTSGENSQAGCSPHAWG